MDKLAVEKAERRLERARESFKAIETTTRFKEFESTWTDFVLAANGIYAALEQGAKSSPQSRQWFGGKKQERRKDPLLQYLHQARNADEHGIEPIAKYSPGGFGVGSTDSTLALDGAFTTAEDFFHLRGVKAGKSGVPWVKIYAPTALLVPVKNTRHGDVFDPPKEHLGAPLANQSPKTVASAALAYLEILVAEARKRVS